MTISVIGTVNRDTVIDLEGMRFESLGGIVYNTLALAALCPDCTVLPVCYCGSDCTEELRALLSPFRNVDYSGIREWKKGSNQNLLRYVNADAREEILDARVPPVERGMIQKALGSELILLNFISGRDMELATAKELRSRFSGTMYMDVHSLVLGIGEDGSRFEQELPDWAEWASCADIIQMNAREARVFTGLEGPEEVISGLVCAAGPGICLITLGEDGVLATFMEDGVLKHELVPAFSARVKDATGCGDVFAAGFISRFIRGEGVRACATEANLRAARCCETAGMEELATALVN